MKKAIDSLLAAAVILPLVLLFWPFAMWNAVISILLRVIPAFAAQLFLFRIGTHTFARAFPLLLTGIFAAWGTYLYFTSPHWNQATFWGSLVADYISPFLSCLAALLACRLAKKIRSTIPPTTTDALTEKKQWTINFC